MPSNVINVALPKRYKVTLNGSGTNTTSLVSLFPGISEPNVKILNYHMQMEEGGGLGVIITGGTGWSYYEFLQGKHDITDLGVVVDNASNALITVNGTIGTYWLVLEVEVV